mgnify:FL=1
MEVALVHFKMNMAGNAAELPQKELVFVIREAVIPHRGANLPIGGSVLN